MMKKTHKPKSRLQLLQELRERKLDQDVLLGHRVCLILTILILHDVFGFTTDELNEYIDKMVELMDSYNAGRENISDWIENIKEETGIDVLGKLDGRDLA